MKILLWAALATLAFGGAVANGCSPSSTEPTLTVDTVAAGTYYIDSDLCPPNGPDCIGTFWIYRESNGKEGLQRGDENIDDTCGGFYEADTIVF